MVGARDFANLLPLRLMYDNIVAKKSFLSSFTNGIQRGKQNRVPLILQGAVPFTITQNMQVAVRLILPHLFTNHYS